MAFVHLHSHTEYSLLDGSNKVKEYVKKVKELGMNAAAITDHGNMFGVINFYKTCKDEGIKPIIGCEVYVAPGSRFDREPNADEDRYNHLVLLVENEVGYKNLCKLVTTGYTEGFYYRPRVDHELLKQYSEGLICLSACLTGEIPQALLKNNYEKAISVAREYQEIFGKDNFYIELQDHGIREQRITNPDLIRIANEIGAKLVVTNDIHYTNKEDAEAQDILLCIQTGKNLTDENRMKFETEEFYVKSEEEMRNLFPSLPEAFDNTQEIANKCNFEFVFGETKLPLYEIPEDFDGSNKDYLIHLCKNGMIKRYGVGYPKEYDERVEYELSVINTMGYTDYFLIVWDFINWAKEHGIPVGPGRGSGAGSIVAYATGITDIDPMLYKLFFERFLNPERVSMPDFDIDFCYERRLEVVDYVMQRYGKERVSQIVTYQTMAAKGSIRDVGRVLNIPYADVDKIAKMIPKDPKITIAMSLEASAELKQEYENNPTCKRIIDIAMKIEGLPKSTSKHAAGVLICDKAIVEYAPLMTDKEGELVIQATMVELEDLGLLKFDFLGLRTLTVIADTVKEIQKKVPDFNIDTIPMDDKATFDMISNGDTLGMFQLESAGMTSFMKELHPTNVEDIIAGISLYRPGPMDFIPQFLENREHPSDIAYTTPELAHILDVTFGCIVYQEQVMQIVRDLAGFSYGRSDLVRRAMSKKKDYIMQEERKNFIYGNEELGIAGCLKNGITEQAANQIYDSMIDFAKYAFNKAHAAAYTVVSYRTAYLVCHYPVEFMCAYLTSYIESDKLGSYCNAVRTEKGIEILPPDYNESGIVFNVVDGKIRFGLSALKGVGKSIISALINEREANDKYSSFYDFAKRMAKSVDKYNKKAYEAMILSGSFDSTGYNRKTLMENYEQIKSQADSETKTQASGQLSLFDFMSTEDQKYTEPVIKIFEEYDEEVKLEHEREVTNLFISGHPLNKYTKAMGIAAVDSIQNIVDSFDEEEAELEKVYKNNEYVTVACVLFDVTKRLTKKGTTMATFKMQDIGGNISAVAFSKCMEESGFLLEDGKSVLVKGKIDVRDDESVQIIVNNVYAMPNNDATEAEFANFTKLMGRNTRPKPQPKVQPQQQVVKPQSAHEKYGRGLYIRIPNKQNLEQIVNLVRTIPGTLPVYIFSVEDNKIYRNDNMKININESGTIRELMDIIGPGNSKLYQK